MLESVARAARGGLVKSSRFGAIALAALLVSGCGSEDADPPRLFSSAVVFGASLTDTGNCGSPMANPCPPAPPYAAGRVSNGTLFVETIAGRYGAATLASARGGTNFAYAGARTGAIPGLATQSQIPSMLVQLQQFVDRPGSAALLNPQTLFVVDASTFGNNITAGLPLVAAATITTTQLVSAGVTDVVTLMTRLYAGGARNILLVNVPDVGQTPLARGLGATTAAGATALAAGFNGALAAQVTTLMTASPGLRVYTLNLFAIQTSIVANPAAVGLGNVTDPCFTTAVCGAPETFLYWDSFHPTRAAGAIIAAQPTTPAMPAP